MHSFFLLLSQRLLVFAMDAALRRALPGVFSRLDAELPMLLSNRVPPAVVKGTIASAISDALGKRATSSQVQAVVALYDPIRNAAALLKR